MISPANVFLSAMTLILVKWTAVLLLGWIIHWVCRDREARLRVVLWRIIFCIGLILPLAPLLPLPQVRIPLNHIGIHSEPISVQEGSQHAVWEQREVTVASPGKGLPQSATGPGLLGVLWAVGTMFYAFRLVSVHVRLSRLRSESQPAPAALLAMSEGIQRRLGLRFGIDLRISEGANSAFVCGLAKPMIVLPKKLSENISQSEASALLIHETAHVRNRDLLWSVCWRWMTVFFWFHPLVWKVPAAHNLACEQEADRIASGELQDLGLYAQLLAQLALRLMAMAPCEAQLGLHGTSQIAHRLLYLGKHRKTPITRWQLWLVGSSTAALFMFLIGGWKIVGASVTEGGGLTASASNGLVEVNAKTELNEGTSVEAAANGKVARVTIAKIGGSPVDETFVRSTIKVKPGDSYDPIAVNADIKNLYNTGRFYGIHVSEDKRPEGVRLLYSVQGRARLTEILFVGNKKFTSAALLEKTTAKIGGLFDARKVSEDSLAIKKLYGDSGYAKAEVRSSSKVEEDSGSARVVFTITEEPKSK